MAVPPINNSPIHEYDEQSENEQSDYSDDEYLFSRPHYLYQDDENVIDEIAELEEDFLDMDKRNGMYFIGSAVYYSEYNSIQLDTTVSPSTFFSYSVENIKLYLVEYSICNITWALPSVHILQLDIKPDGEYCVIVKTFWIKLIQRAWKKQYALRLSVILARSNIAAQSHFELTGTYPSKLRHIPGIRGLLTL